MRILALGLLAAACATAAVPPPERVAGCWVSRGEVVSTMRWFVDPAQDGAWRGERLRYPPGGAPENAQYTLSPSALGYSLCELGAAQCWTVAQGEGGSLAGGRAFVDSHGGRLRISIIGDGPERIIFSGRRDGCD